MLLSPGQRPTVLMFGCWPDRRGGGISSVTHDLVLGLNEIGWDVLLTYPGSILSREETKEAIHATHISNEEPFEWQQATDRAVRFESFGHLIREGMPEFTLANVSVIHSHFDTIIPEESSSVEHSYRPLVEHVQRLTGRRPVFVRTRHDDLQSGLGRLMRLTGVDFLQMNPQHREALLASPSELERIVGEHVRRHRDSLRRQGYSDSYLDEAIHHVWFIVHQLNLWRREQEDADAIVSLSRSGANLLRHFHPGGKSNLAHIYNGTSMVDCDRASVDERVRTYHTEAGLRCYRGEAEEQTPIEFSPHDHKVLYVGRDDHAKGVIEFIHAASRLYHKRPERPLRAILVGEFTVERRRELCRIDPEHASEYLLFTGWIDDPEVMLSILAFGNVTAIPSYWDSFNLAACESYLAATPCVITEGIGAAEIYLEQPARHGCEIALPIERPFQAGINRFHGVRVDSLESQIARLLDDDALAYRLGRDGQAFVSRHYDYRVMGRRYTELYRSLLAAQN
ncbi:MAG: glycosyltransferase family 4 protein [Planctomycetota bacterium]